MPSGAFLRYIAVAAVMCLNCHLGVKCQQLPCHCANNEACHSNGYCPSGCSPGWYGPGCQVGNLAFGKPANQSSTYVDVGLVNNASLAVDGNVPNDNSSQFCTHTTNKESNPWWYVTLAADKFFVIQNVTILNRQGGNGKRLHDFYILYSNDTNGNPDPQTWSNCTYQNEAPGVLSNYSCPGSAIGRRVAVYFKNVTGRTESFLTLCEVYVDGYAYLECSEPYTGPGCLLHRCNSTSCTQASGTCDTFGGCKFPACPNNTHLPPDCWIISDTIVPGTTEALAGGLTGGVALVAVIVVVAVFLWRRKKAMPTPSDSKLKYSTMIATPIDASSIDLHTVTEDQPYDNMAGMSLPQFKAYVTDRNSITARFSELVAQGSQPCLAGSDPLHKSKNRFQNIIPYDSNRVVLLKHEDNYINASYINGFDKSKLYIATQGPTARTIEDFWQMVWQENSSVIVMLTDYIEHAKKKCEKYFPTSGSVGCPLTVSVNSVSKYDTHTITILVLQREGEARHVSHFHFLLWPDQSVPEHAALMLLFHRKIRAAMQDPKHQNGPVVVHCSAGAGRTGAFLACDLLEQRYIAQGRIEVDSCVMQLRDQRMQIVQTKDQYIFVHVTVLYSMMTSGYIFDSAGLAAYVKKASQVSPSGCAFSQEWQVLQDCLPPYDSHHFAAATHSKNVLKNRDSRILASDLKRHILASRDEESQGYINAVYCNGCYSHKGFLVTQLPLRDTIADFWQMVYEANASCIVLVHELPEDKDCPQYWPNPGESVRTGSFVVTNKAPAFIPSSAVAHEFSLTVEPGTSGNVQAETLSLKLFVLKIWSWSAEVPADHEHFLKVADTLKTHCKDTVDRPMVVQCKDGASHSGLFVSTLNSLHRLVECNQVQVFHSVDLIRISRREFVTGQTQYRFIYEVLRHYCEAANIYANV